MGPASSPPTLTPPPPPAECYRAPRPGRLALQYMFDHATSFNKDLNKWDTSKVTNMRVSRGACLIEPAAARSTRARPHVLTASPLQGIFNRAQRFNSDLSNWDVSKVTDMFVSRVDSVEPATRAPAACARSMTARALTFPPPRVAGFLLWYLIQR